jgi:hypothetical protein
MLHHFLAECCTSDPAARVSARELFNVFKTMPGVESWRRARFINELLRAKIDVRQERGGLYVYGLTIVA